MGLLDDDEFNRWRSQARSTVATAHLAADGAAHGWACFLCEQAAQLAVKGLLHAIGKAAWGHDLPLLVDRATTELQEEWPGVPEVAEELSRHYIPARYPDAHPSGTPEDHYNSVSSKTAFDHVALVLDAVDAAWERLRSEPEEAS